MAGVERRQERKGTKATKLEAAGGRWRSGRDVCETGWHVRTVDSHPDFSCWSPSSTGLRPSELAETTMRRIVSALGLARDKDRRDARHKKVATPARSPLRSESTPALVYYSPDSASSSGIRTPSDIEAPDMLAVPMVHPSASTESVAHSVRSSRWLPVSLFRSLSRKRPEPVSEVPPVSGLLGCFA